jgi:hypothetical protein
LGRVGEPYHQLVLGARRGRVEADLQPDAAERAGRAAAQRRKARGLQQAREGVGQAGERLANGRIRLRPLHHRLVAQEALAQLRRRFKAGGQCLGLGWGRCVLDSQAGRPASCGARPRPPRPASAFARTGGKLLLQRFGPPRRSPLRSVTSLRGGVGCRAAQPAPHPAAPAQPRPPSRAQARPGRGAHPEPALPVEALVVVGAVDRPPRLAPRRNSALQRGRALARRTPAHGAPDSRQLASGAARPRGVGGKPQCIGLGLGARAPAWREQHLQEEQLLGGDGAAREGRRREREREAQPRGRQRPCRLPRAPPLPHACGVAASCHSLCRPHEQGLQLAQARASPAHGPQPRGSAALLVPGCNWSGPRLAEVQLQQAALPPTRRSRPARGGLNGRRSPAAKQACVCSLLRCRASLVHAGTRPRDVCAGLHPACLEPTAAGCPGSMLLMHMPHASRGHAASPLALRLRTSLCWNTCSPARPACGSPAGRPCCCAGGAHRLAAAHRRTPCCSPHATARLASSEA